VEDETPILQKNLPPYLIVTRIVYWMFPSPCPLPHIGVSGKVRVIPEPLLAMFRSDILFLGGKQAIGAHDFPILHKH
jgi:hypothetical protein